MSSTSDISTAEAPHGSPPANKGLRDVWYSKGGTTFRKFIGAVLYRLFRLGGELTSVVLGLAFAVSWMSVVVLDKQSTDLTVLRPNIKLWFADAFDGRDAEFGRLELTWLPTTNNMIVTIEDAKVTAKNGQVLEDFEYIHATFAPNEENWMRPRLINASIRGGALSYIENDEGRIVAGLGPPETVGRFGPVYRSENTERLAFNMTSALKELEFVQIENAKIYVQNAISGVDLRSNVDLLRASFSENGDLVVNAAGTVDQETDPMQFTLSSISDPKFDEFKVKLKATGARPVEIAPSRGRFWEFKGLAAPVDLFANIDFSRREGLKSASVDMNVAAGRFTLPRELEEREFPLDSLVFRASLAPGDQRMDVEAFDLSAPGLFFKSSGFLTELDNLSDGDPNSSPEFNLSLQNIRADMTSLFSAETRIKRLDIVGQADVDSRTLNIRRGRLDVFDSVHQFDANLAFKSNNAVKSLRLNSYMSGVLSPEQLLSFWPVKTFPGARGWIEESLLEADVSEFDAEVNFDEDFFENPMLNEERLNLRFGGTNAAVKYIGSLPPATAIQGRGGIFGNRLNFRIDSGQTGGVNLTGGTVDIPRLFPRNGDIIVTVDSQGAVSEFMRLADYPPFEIAKKYNVDPNNLSGQGNLKVVLTRALTPFLPRDQIDYQITGNFTGASAPFDFGKYGIENGTVSLDANRDRVNIAGPVDIGPWRADMQWQENFGGVASLAKYGVKGTITPDVLDALGIASRSWFAGSAEVQIDAEGRGKDIVSAVLDVDLTNSELTAERIWTKPKAEPARLVGNLTRSLDNGYILDGLGLKGADLEISGSLELDRDFKAQSLDLSNVQIADLINGAVRITPDRSAGRLGLDVKANYLNVSPWTEDLFAERQSNLDVPLILRGEVDLLVLDPEYEVTNSVIDFSHTGEVIETARLEALSDGKPLKLELTTRPDLKRQLNAEVPDASKAVRAFLGLGNTSGGRLEVEMNLPASGEDGAFVGVADMRDFRLTRAPAMAQLLSLASLTGLSDTLSGGSMQFDRFKLPFTLLGDDIAIRDARLYGPALGMTGDGDVDLDLRVLDFDGTLVPAYATNSFLGDIPILGDILVQEKGGGVFALTYTVSGSFEKTQIAVNPLSALTPGFLRKIFSKDRSDIDDAMREAIEDVAPKEAEAP